MTYIAERLMELDAKQQNAGKLLIATGFIFVAVARLDLLTSINIQSLCARNCCINFTSTHINSTLIVVIKYNGQMLRNFIHGHLMDDIELAYK